MRRFAKKMTSGWILLIGISVAVTVIWQVTRWVHESEMAALAETGRERLTLYSGTLNGALNRLVYLPYVLARYDGVERVLTHGDNVEQLNLDLESLNRWAGSEALYVMDAMGDTLASSNWQDSLSYVGHNYGYRPYFTDARAGDPGRFFAIGATTGRPGYFMSQPVSRLGQFLGIVVVKVDLTPLQDDWHEGGETVLVSDDDGILFLSSRKEWKYTTLAPLTAEQREKIDAARQYGDQPLPLSPLQTTREISADQRIVRADGVDYLMLSRTLNGFDWKIFHVAPLAPVQERVQAVAAISTASALLILALGMYLRERRQKQASRLKAREAEATKEINLRLQEEIEEHYRTEQALRDAQAELVQTSKLAALGQMAAGIVHELNQPIAAMRTYAASGRLLLDRGQQEKAHDTFSEVTRITDHMAAITAQLKIFAHKTPRQNERVELQTCLDGALSMTAALLGEVGVELEKTLSRQPVLISGDRGRIEQVLVNLIRNGVDAMREVTKRSLLISLTSAEEMAEIAITDSGPGIEEQYFDELFNPFFTTKEVGKGLGLGLSISYRIVTDLGGTIRAINNQQGGASFIVRLPLAKTDKIGAEE